MTRPTAAPVPDPTVLRLRAPGDILGVIPYLLGFHPEESLVAVFVQDRRVAVTARVDLAATSDLEGLLDQLEMVALRVGSRSLVLVGYSADEGIRELMGDLAGLIPLDLVDVLAVSGHRWWSVLCEDDCCPPEGEPYDIAAHPLAAEAVLAGIPAWATRAEIAALTAGPSAGDQDRLAASTQSCAERVARLSRRRRKRRMGRLVARALAAGSVSEDTAVELAVLAADVAVRDVAWLLMSSRRAAEHVAVWRRVVSVAVPPYEAAPLGMLAMAGWLDGNGALLNCCIDRLEEVAPGYSLLGICRDISDRAVPPSCFDGLLRDLGPRGG